VACFDNIERGGFVWEGLKADNTNYEGGECDLIEILEIIATPTDWDCVKYVKKVLEKYG